MDTVTSYHIGKETTFPVVSSPFDTPFRSAFSGSMDGVLPHFLPSAFAAAWDDVLTEHAERAAEQTMRELWRSFWCNGYRHLAASHPSSYPPTAWGFERAITGLSPLIRSLINDLNLRSDAWSTNDHLPDRRSCREVHDQDVSHCPPAPSSATLARWIRQDRARSKLRILLDQANLNAAEA